MRSDRTKRGILVLIIGLILAVFGQADIQYWITNLSYEADWIITIIGGVISLIGIGYIILGLKDKSSTSYPSVQPQSVPPPQPSPVSNVSFCTQCGHQVDEKAAFCPNCGFKRL